MPLQRLVLTVIAVIAAAGVTLGVAGLLAGGPALPAASVTAAGTVAMIASLTVRLIAGRRADRGDVRHDDPES